MQKVAILPHRNRHDAVAWIFEQVTANCHGKQYMQTVSSLARSYYAAAMSAELVYSHEGS